MSARDRATYTRSPISLLQGNVVLVCDGTDSVGRFAARLLNSNLESNRSAAQGYSIRLTLVTTKWLSGIAGMVYMYRPVVQHYVDTLQSFCTRGSRVYGQTD